MTFFPICRYISNSRSAGTAPAISFRIFRPGSSAACLDRRRGSSRRPHESKSLRHLLRHDIILFDPCEKLNCSEFLFRIFNSRQTCLFRLPLSPIFRKDLVSEFQRVIQDIFIVKRQKPVFHIPGRIILRDPESHNTGEVSALFFLDRPESKLKHFVVVLRVSGDLLRRIQTVIDMIFHDLLIVALRDLTENDDKYNWEEHKNHFILADTTKPVDFGEAFRFSRILASVYGSY